MSWFTWCVLALLLTGAALAEGQTMSAVMSGVTAVITGLIFVFGLKQGNKSLDKFDVVSLVGAALGIGVWAVLDNPALAIFVAVTVDIIAFMPTIVHGWVAPEEESVVSFGLSSAGSGLGLLAAVLSGAALTGVVYPLYATVFNGAMILLLTRETWLGYLAALLPLAREEEVLAD
ncbi:hypothetical protein EOL96_00670 [Candidatus Saccharibacteria bacterium]|nr:hypothetical protein [Candidatus Saccharibacteria bacterium]